MMVSIHLTVLHGVRISVSLFFKYEISFLSVPAKMKPECHGIIFSLLNIACGARQLLAFVLCVPSLGRCTMTD